MELHERLSTVRPAPIPIGRDPFAEVKNRIHLAVIGELGPQLFNVSMDPNALRERVADDIKTHLGDEQGLSRDDRDRIAAEIADDILAHGPLERLLADDSVTEIMVNGPYDVWVERQGRLYETTVRFTDESHLRRIINKIVAQVGRRVDESSPMVDARLPDGSRVNALIPPLSLSGPLLTIRKFSKKRLDMNDLIRLGTLSTETVEFLQRCILAELNILISGGTGSGKTTLLNALSTAIPDSERIVTIEDAAELRLNQRHVLRLEARPKNIEGEGEIPIRELVRNSLRMRPDRIIVGEVRGSEALDMLQAMNTGHDGSLSTVHANTARDALARIETMVLMAGYDLPVRAIRQQVASAIDLIIHLERLEDGGRRVTAITEVQRMESEVITLQDIFDFKIREITSERVVVGSLQPTGLRPTFLSKFEKRGVTLPVGLFMDGRSAGEPCRPWMERDAAVRFRAAFVGLVSALALSSTAVAADGVSLRPTGGTNFPDRAYVLSLPTDTALGPGSIEVRENGQVMSNVSIVPAQAADNGQFGVVLVLDASDSMRGDADRKCGHRGTRIRRASADAASFWALSSSTRRQWSSYRLRPTRTLVDSASGDEPELAHGTHIYDAVGTAVTLLKQAEVAAPAIVVLSRRRRHGQHEVSRPGERGGAQRRRPGVLRRASIEGLQGRRAPRVGANRRWRVLRGQHPRGSGPDLRCRRRQARERISDSLPLAPGAKPKSESCGDRGGLSRCGDRRVSDPRRFQHRRGTFPAFVGRAVRAVDRRHVLDRAHHRAHLREPRDAHRQAPPP